MTRADDVAAAKAALRTTMIAARAALSPEERAAGAAELACLPIGDAVRSDGAILASYRPIGAEIDPLPLEAVLRAGGLAVALPVIVGGAKPLIFRHVTDETVFVTRKWGIQEPNEDAADTVPDILILPLLAFDARGRRLGYGGGYYDRTLRALRAQRPVVAIGVAFDLQRVDAVPHLDYDEPLDWVATPGGLLRCAGG